MTRLARGGALLTALVFVGGACGRPSPSEVPLGGQDDPVQSPSDEPAREVSEGPARRAPPTESAEPPPAEQEEEDDEESSEEEIIIDGDDGGDGDSEELEEGPETGRATPQAPPEAGVARAPGCDDSVPAVLGCRSLGNACPALAPLCRTLEGMLKPAVGQALADCIVEQSCAMGDMSCVKIAIRRACVDDDARAFCEDRTEECGEQLGDLSREDCEYGVSALLPEVRRRFTACMANSCDVRQCLGRVTPPPH